LISKQKIVATPYILLFKNGDCFGGFIGARFSNGYSERTPRNIEEIKKRLSDWGMI